MSEKANRKLVNIISNASDQADIDASLESNANARQLENHFYLDY
jgi:hypothetical protein